MIWTGVIKPDNMSSGIQLGNTAASKMVKTKNPRVAGEAGQADDGCSC